MINKTDTKSVRNILGCQEINVKKKYYYLPSYISKIRENEISKRK